MVCLLFQWSRKETLSLNLYVKNKGKGPAENFCASGTNVPSINQSVCGFSVAPKRYPSIQKSLPVFGRSIVEKESNPESFTCHLAYNSILSQANYKGKLDLVVKNVFTVEIIFLDHSCSFLMSGISIVNICKGKAMRTQYLYNMKDFLFWLMHHENKF